MMRMEGSVRHQPLIPKMFFRNDIWLRDFAVGSVVTPNSWLNFVMIVSDRNETDHNHFSLTISSASLVVRLNVLVRTAD